MVLNMIVRISIEKVGQGAYLAHCTGDPWPPKTHTSIADCLRDYGTEIAPEFAQFANIEYAGCQLETTAIADLEPRAEELAGRLVELIAGVHAAA
ncbi:hypothetical protein RQP54_17830 [Curvibacter sp. APW13]|uniref:hypothetical protein n=1 Tax=Curvibacter sp. APW13 TaxID=3077236 RepID=UPI0028DEF419|nr:hypothetical protein [Curvibacter sp. APW13]MDT8992737.1 hypothetical protein [Curvibacter sp. APW13]